LDQKNRFFSRFDLATRKFESTIAKLGNSPAHFCIFLQISVDELLKLMADNVDKLFDNNNGTGSSLELSSASSKASTTASTTQSKSSNDDSGSAKNSTTKNKNSSTIITRKMLENAFPPLFSTGSAIWLDEDGKEDCAFVSSRLGEKPKLSKSTDNNSSSPDARLKKAAQILNINSDALDRMRGRQLELCVIKEEKTRFFHIIIGLIF